MGIPQGLQKVRRIYAEAASAKLAHTPPAERVKVLRGMLLAHGLKLRRFIADGHTEAYGIPLIDILRSTQRMLLDVRNLREVERRTRTLN